MFTTIIDFKPIKDFFKIRPHHLNTTVKTSLNNVYSEPLEDAIIDTLFTDAQHIIVAPNAVINIKTATINTIDPDNQADCVIIAQVINKLPLYTHLGTPPHCYPLRTTIGITLALKVALANR